jgi:C1A family cysteine protease
MAIILCLPTILSAAEGDVDGSGNIDLRDVTTAIQICAGMNPPDLKADITEANKITLADAVFALQVVSGIVVLPYDPGDMGMPDDYEATMISMTDTFPDTGSYEDFIAELPQIFDWRDKGIVTRAKDERPVTPADNQGYCGSCWAFAAVGAMESKILMAGGPEYDISEQQQVSCNTEQYGCCGGFLNASLFWKDRGPMQESCTDYGDYRTSSCNCLRHCSNVPCSSLDTCPQLFYLTDKYYSVNADDKNDVKISLRQDGPAPFRFLVYKDFFDFWNSGSSGEIYKQSDDRLSGGHAVLLIGWDDAKQAWLCKNSWGERGPNGDGTFWLAYSGHANNLRFGMTNFTIKNTEPATTSTTSTTTTSTTTTIPNEQGNYYINFQNPDGNPTANPLTVNGKTYMKIGWNTYSEILGYGWYGDMAHVMYHYLDYGSDELQKSIIYDDWGREKTFEFNLPNGIYNVTVSVGWDSYYNKTFSHHKITVEGISFINDEATTPSNPYIVRTKEVTVEDGKLTMEMGIFDEYTMLNYMDIEAVGGTSTTTTTISDGGPKLVGLVEVKDITESTALASSSFAFMLQPKEKGFCWSVHQTPKPSLTNNMGTIKNVQTEGSAFTATLTGLEPDTAYYLVSYAISSDGTYISYSDETVQFVTAGSSPNYPPTDISLSNTIIDENQSSITVGTLTTTDPDAGDTHTYSLISGSGATHNAFFRVDGNILKTAASLTEGIYNIRLMTDDSKGGTFEKSFTITVKPTITTTTSSTTTTVKPTTTTTIPNEGDGIKLVGTPEVANTTETTASVSAPFAFMLAPKEKGFCWSAQQTPKPSLTNNMGTIKNVQTEGPSFNIFTAFITGLEPATTYYIVAYAISRDGSYISYSDETVSFTTKSTTTTTSTIPYEGDGPKLVGTPEVTNRTATTASVSAPFAFFLQPKEKGFCWSAQQTPKPSLANNTIKNVQAEGSFFTAVITGLEPATTYYIVAYAISSDGSYVSYSDETVSFSTGEFIRRHQAE